jgi:hypothetical protein
LVGTAAAADSNETDFAYVTRMPDVEGVLRETRESVDPRRGVAMRKRVYVYDHEGFELWTHVIEAACAGLADPGDGPGEPTIVALQYFPKAPKSFSVAAMPDLYLEVFARDEDRRIRAYQQLNGRQIAALTDRFLPVCRPS